MQNLPKLRSTLKDKTKAKGWQRGGLEPPKHLNERNTYRKTQLGTTHEKRLRRIKVHVALSNRENAKSAVNGARLVDEKDPTAMQMRR